MLLCAVGVPPACITLRKRTPGLLALPLKVLHTRLLSLVLPWSAGAGKTNIAMLSVLREVGTNMRHGVIQKVRPSWLLPIVWSPLALLNSYAPPLGGSYIVAKLGNSARQRATWRD